jgi:probable addiction module antidote protein
MTRPDRPHDEIVIELMRDDPAFAQELREECLASVGEPGRREALLSPLRCYAEAQGMNTIAQQTGLSRESLFRTLSPSGNPTLKTLLIVFNGDGFAAVVYCQQYEIRTGYQCAGSGRAQSTRCIGTDTAPSTARAGTCGVQRAFVFGV